MIMGRTLTEMGPQMPPDLLEILQNTVSSYLYEQSFWVLILGTKSLFLKLII